MSPIPNNSERSCTRWERGRLSRSSRAGSPSAPAPSPACGVRIRLAFAPSLNATCAAGYSTTALPAFAVRRATMSCPSPSPARIAGSVHATMTSIPIDSKCRTTHSLGVKAGVHPCAIERVFSPWGIWLPRWIVRQPFHLIFPGHGTKTASEPLIRLLHLKISLSIWAYQTRP